MQLGPWEITREIAAGGMSMVYRGRRSDGAYEQDVAIKFFHTDLMSGHALARFDAERKILASLDHPGIARIIDAGTTRDGVPYVVMELVSGQPITKYCDQAGLDLEQRLRLFQSVCRALQVAHSRHVVHRDIKPGNVLAGDDGQVRLIDFGIAKVLEEGNIDASLPATRMDSQIYTPEYASPEQVRGEALGTSSDIYSLGVLLYELLVGQRPYEIDSLSPAGIEATVCQTVPVDPSKAVRRKKDGTSSQESRTLSRQLRGDLDRIVMTALRKNPQHRYRSAADFADDIERYLTGLPVLADGAPLGYRLGKFLHRHPGASIATALMVLVLVVALVVTSLHAVEVQRQAERATAAQQFLQEMIARAEPWESAGNLTLVAALKQAIPSVSEQFSGQPMLEAEMRRVIGYALSGQGETEAARQQLTAAWNVLGKQGSRWQKAQLMNDLAGVSWGEGDYEKAREQYLTALELITPDDSREGLLMKFDTLVSFSGLLPKMDQPELSLKYSDQALALLEKHPGLAIDAMGQAILWNNRAHALDLLENYPGSIEAYQTSIRLHREINPQGSPDMAVALANLGMTYEMVDDMPLAVDYLQQAADMQRQLLGPEHPQYLLAVFNLGSLQYNADDLEGAIHHIRIAVDAADEAYTPDHFYTGRFNHRLAESLAQAGRSDEAAIYAKKALKIYQTHEDVPPNWLESATQLAQ